MITAEMGLRLILLQVGIAILALLFTNALQLGIAHPRGPLLPIVVIVAGAAAAPAFARTALRGRPRTMTFNPVSRSCVVAGRRTRRRIASFPLNSATLHVVRIEQPGEEQPWGFAVVLSANGVRFPLAAVRTEAEVEQYLSNLPIFIHDRLDPDVDSATVDHLWNRTDIPRPSELRLQVAVPYRLRPSPSPDRRAHVFGEEIGHQRFTMGVYVALMACCALSAWAAWLTAYPRVLHPPFLAILGTTMTLFFLRWIRKRRGRQLWVYPSSDICIVALEDTGEKISISRISLANLRLIEFTVKGRPKPEGFTVVLETAETMFPLAAVSNRQRADEYIASLPPALRQRLHPEVRPAEVDRIWQRGWSD
ncbi:MAG: hypothetical protein ACF8R7_02890 [Phycisphaerales bacterium JB039]